MQGTCGSGNCRRGSEGVQRRLKRRSQLVPRVPEAGFASTFRRGFRGGCRGGFGKCFERGRLSKLFKTHYTPSNLPSNPSKPTFKTPPSTYRCRLQTPLQNFLRTPFKWPSKLPLTPSFTTYSKPSLKNPANKTFPTSKNIPNRLENPPFNTLVKPFETSVKKSEGASRR